MRLSTKAASCSWRASQAEADKICVNLPTQGGNLFRCKVRGDECAQLSTCTRQIVASSQTFQMDSCLSDQEKPNGYGSKPCSPGEHQNKWQMDVHPPKMGHRLCPMAKSRGPPGHQECAGRGWAPAQCLHAKGCSHRNWGHPLSLNHQHISVDERNSAPPKKPWNEDSCKCQQTTGFPWFQSGAGFRPPTVLQTTPQTRSTH